MLYVSKETEQILCVCISSSIWDNCYDKILDYEALLF